METKNILKELVEIPSPSSFETNIRKVIEKMVAPYVDSVTIDVHGNLYCSKKTHNSINAKNLMLIAHMDEVGLMITYIEENGYIRFSNIGGVDANILKGRVVQVFHKDTIIYGVIGTKPARMTKDSEPVKVDFSDLWIDLGLKNKSEAEKHVSIGDYIVVSSNYFEMPNRLVSCRGCDNKSGVVVLIKLLEIIANYEISCNIDVVMSVQEEIGLRGAKTASYHLSPDYCIAVDVTHATDYPSINKAKFGDIRIGAGPVIPIGADFSNIVQDSLRSCASVSNINYQVSALPNSSSTDINAVQVAKGGCYSGLIAIPCRYMHTPVEVISLNDLENVCNILVKFIRSL